MSKEGEQIKDTERSIKNSLNPEKYKWFKSDISSKNEVTKEKMDRAFLQYVEIILTRKDLNDEEKIKFLKSIQCDYKNITEKLESASIQIFEKERE